MMVQEKDLCDRRRVRCPNMILCGSKGGTVYGFDVDKQRICVIQFEGKRE
ncbi:hypothetical protein HanRHA438_Chr11g0501511 [Helianthus annuus]|nr:hypothetical protein HanRHA438_Chr11g0501511 [Helianthus annuus]